MSQDSDIPVVVVSGRVDIDLAISLWVSGYRAHRALQVDTVLDLTKDGGLVVLDARSETCADWLEKLRTQGYPGPVVLLDDRVTACVSTDDAAVRTPWTLDGMKEAFELARHLRTSPGTGNAAVAGEGLFAVGTPSETWAAKVAPEGAVPTASEPRPRRIRRLV